jgi:hypothetical protein
LRFGLLHHHLFSRLEHSKNEARRISAKSGLVARDRARETGCPPRSSAFSNKKAAVLILRYYSGLNVVDLQREFCSWFALA